MTTAIGMDPYFLATQQMPYGTSAQAMAEYYGRLLAAQQNQNTQTATSNVTFQGTQPQVKRAAQEEKSAAGTAITLGTIATLGAVAFFGHRSGKQVLQKLGKEENLFQTIWTGVKSWFPKFGQQADNLIKSSQEYTLVKDGMTITVKDGKIAKILEKNGVDILEGDKLTKWLDDNKEISKAVKNLKIKKADTLPDGVVLRYEKIIDGRKFVVENNEIVEIYDTANRRMTGDKFTNFIKNHPEDAKNATTLTRKFSRKTTTGACDEIELSKFNDGTIKVKINGKDATDAELKSIKSAYKNEFENFGKVAIDNNTYEGLAASYYTYQVNGDRVILDSVKPKNILKIERITEKTLADEADINKLLDEKGLKDQLNTIMNDGKLSDGWGFGELFVKTNGGHICEISDNGKALKSIKLNKEFTYNGNTYKSGDKIEGDVLEAWKKDSSNASEIEKILELLK